MTAPNPDGLPRPFLKWAGGKRQLLPGLLQAVRSAQSSGRYFEPFLGGGALFFALAQRGLLSRGASLADVNPNLMDAYLGVREDVDAVVQHLRRHEQVHDEAHFYAVRQGIPETLAGRAARVIYLNRTGFNGLYRENSKGEFNVPFGRYRNPLICDEPNLRAAAAELARVDLSVGGFDDSLSAVAAGDLVYLDPPYPPTSPTASFTAYAKGGFGEADQRALAACCANLQRVGARVILSNAMLPQTLELYPGFYIYRLLADRFVNSRGDRRGKVAEALVTSFPLVPADGTGTLEAGLMLVRDPNGRAQEVDLERWLQAHGYADVAATIGAIKSEWKAAGKSTRRNWWAVLAGSRTGRPRRVAGREFPILRAAQERQGLPVTANAETRNAVEIAARRDSDAP